MTSRNHRGATLTIVAGVAAAALLNVTALVAQERPEPDFWVPASLRNAASTPAHNAQPAPAAPEANKKAKTEKMGPEPEPDIPHSLKLIPVPEPSDLATYIRDKAAAIRLGKALFWDMQLGSDNQACASCHFHAGADNRSKNALNPGLRSIPPDHTYQLPGPNYQFKPSDYPFHKLVDPNNRRAGTKSDVNDITGSQGTYHKEFIRVGKNKPMETGKLLPDPDFTTATGIQVRRVEPRNTPTVINAVFNVDNFWDGRANYYFNGNNPFGPLDMNSGIFVTGPNGALQKKIIRIEKSSLASQAVGPPLSDFEMSYSGRGWPDVGKKMLLATPLALQIVHANDSVLGSLSANNPGNGNVRKTGLATDYVTMIKQAFWPQYWNSTMIVTYDSNGNPVFSTPPKRPLTVDEFTQMEANFAFFFGLAIQSYESTLVSNDSPFDKYQENWFKNPLTMQQRLGMAIYLGKGHCANCHTGAEFTSASLSFREMEKDPTDSHGGVRGRRVELMRVGPNGELVQFGFDVPTRGSAFYDGGWYNVGVRPINDDIGRGGDSPFTNPRTGAPFPLSVAKQAILMRQGLLPPEVAQYVAPSSAGAPRRDEAQFAVDGTFKVPTLRNVELTGPYFHNGGEATLMQVVNFYNRGGNFHDENIADLHPDISDKFMTETEKKDLVEFLLTLTDDRVRYEKAPFDHPQLFIPNGATDKLIPGDPNSKDGRGWRLSENIIELPAVGAGGLAAEGLPPIGTYLNLDPRKADTSVP